MNGVFDDIFGSLRKAPTESRDLAGLHPGALMGDVDGGLRFAFVSWSSAPDSELFPALQRLVEGALLMELSRGADDLVEVPPLEEIVLLACEPLAEAALRPFGFERVLKADFVPRADWALRRFRGEASAMGKSDEIEEIWIAPARTNTAPALFHIHEYMMRRASPLAFGEPPGALFALYNQALRADERAPLAPTRASLDAMSAVLFPELERVIRWTSPLGFQALCDACAVVLASEFGKKVAWASAMTPPETPRPPPMIRVGGEGGHILHLGVELLRWSVMPRQTGESIPPLSEWISDRARD